MFNSSEFHFFGSISYEIHILTGWTPLHYAARCGHLAVFKFIFETIKYKEPKTSDGRTPLKVAIQFENYDICQFIKDSRSSKDSVNHL